MSARYLCQSCWRTLSPAETVRLPPAAQPPAVPPPAAAPPVEAVPVDAVPVLAAPATKAKARVGLHWIEDPNVEALPAAAVRTAVVAAPPPPAGDRASESAAEGVSRKKWSGWVDSLLGEGDDAEDAAGGEAAEGPVFCRCGAALGAGARLEGSPSLLGFAGAPQAGKKLLLLAMLHQLELAEPEPAGKSPRIALEGLGAADEIFRARWRELYRNGKKPPAAGQGHLWRLRWSRPDARAAGLRRPQPLPGGRAQLVGLLEGGDEEALQRCRALLNLLLFVVDGATLAADLELDGGDAWCGTGGPGDLGAGDLRRFAELCHGLGRRSRDLSLAIVVTKSDLLAQSDAWAGLGPTGELAGAELAGAEREAKIARLLKESWRGRLVDEAREKFRRVGLFACSSLGFRPSAGDLGGEEGQPASLRRRPRPHRVLEPLHFLLEDVLPRRRP